MQIRAQTAIPKWWYKFFHKLTFKLEYLKTTKLQLRPFKKSGQYTLDYTLNSILILSLSKYNINNTHILRYVS